MVYYVTHSKKIPIKYRAGKIHFFARKKDFTKNFVKNKKYESIFNEAKKNIGKRAIIELKLSKSESVSKNSQKKFYDRIKKDFLKIKNIDAEYKLLVCVIILLSGMIDKLLVVCLLLLLLLLVALELRRTGNSNVIYYDEDYLLLLHY